MLDPCMPSIEDWQGNAGSPPLSICASYPRRATQKKGSDGGSLSCGGVPGGTLRRTACPGHAVLGDVISNIYKILGRSCLVQGTTTDLANDGMPRACCLLLGLWVPPTPTTAKINTSEETRIEDPLPIASIKTEETTATSTTATKISTTTTTTTAPSATKHSQSK